MHLLYSFLLLFASTQGLSYPKNKFFHLFDILLVPCTVAFFILACYNKVMDRNSQPKKAKYFKYRFTKTIIALIFTVIALCGAGIAVSIYRIAKFGIPEWSDALKSPLLIAACVFCIALVVGILIKSQYIIDETHYTTQFGFIKSKFPIKDITKLELDTDTHKLTVFIGEEFSVLSLSPAWNDEFIAALREANPNIEFTFTLAEKSEHDEK